MQGLQILYALPAVQKTAIESRFVSIEQLYQTVFELYKEDYDLFVKRPKGYEQRREIITAELKTISDTLDAMMIPGRIVLSHISADHGEIIVDKKIKSFEEYAVQHGSAFDKMKEWLKRQR